MADLSKRDRDRGLAYAKRLRSVAWEAPDDIAESKVHALASQLERLYGYTARLKKAHICRHIEALNEEGLDTSIRDLCDRFKWRRDVVTHTLGELEAEGVIEFYDFKPSGPGGRGRPHRRIRLRRASAGQRA